MHLGPHGGHFVTYSSISALQFQAQRLCLTNGQSLLLTEFIIMCLSHLKSIGTPALCHTLGDPVIALSEEH